MSTLTAKIQLRRDTASNWATNDPILAAGEVAFTSDVFYSGTDQQRFKIGDGVQTWSQLDYVPEGGGGTSYPEHLYLTVVNKTGDNLLASGYKVVKVIDAQGQRLAVDYALADSDTNSADTIGVVFENINNNQEGKIVVVGDLTSLNTTGTLQGETWADGDPIYLSATTPGGITNIKPTAPDHGVRLGYVVYAHANQGKIYVKIDNGYEINELHDCYLPTPTNNDGIFWSSGTTRYENKSIATALGYTPENTANKGVANGYAPLNSSGKINSTFLPVREIPIQIGWITEAFNPADSTTYYFGNPLAIPSTGNSNVVRRITMPKTGIITALYSNWNNNTVSSNENNTIQIRNITTNTTVIVTTTFQYVGQSQLNVILGTPLNVNENDLIDIIWTTPIYVTNPTQSRVFGYIILEY